MLRILLSLLFFSWLVDGDRLEDAKDLINLFKSVVDVPLSKDFKKANLFTATSQAFLKKMVPFGELLARALKNGIKESELDALLNLTNGIDAKASHIRLQLGHIQNIETFRDLLLGYNREVGKPIRILMTQLQLMTHARIKATEEEIGRFVRSCLGINSPIAVAQYLSEMVGYCETLSTDSAISELLYDMIHEQQYINYTLNHEKEMKFFKRYAGQIRDKSVFLAILMNEFEIGERLNTLCLPSAAFLSNGYKRAGIEFFGDILMSHAITLLYLATMCSNITYFGHPDKAEIFMSEFERALQPTQHFISNWIEQTLESTWSNQEKLLIRDLLHSLAGGSEFPESNSTYANIVNSVSEKMEPIGHPLYRRQYVCMKEHVSGFNNKHLSFNCHNDACMISTAMKASCIVIRTNTRTNQVYESLERLHEFKNKSVETFMTAMNNDFYYYDYPSRMITMLADQYGLDFEEFAHHSTYIVLHEKVYSKPCSNLFATKSDDNLGTNFLQTLNYHWNGDAISKCVDWVIILGF